MDDAIDYTSEAYSGGRLTHFDRSKNAFNLPAPGLTVARNIDFQDGNAFFDVSWTTPPSSAVSGLGPTFNARSCQSCHASDGRGRPPASTSELMLSMLVRLSDGNDPIDGPQPLDGYGGQLQNRGTVSADPGEWDDAPREGRTVISYTLENGTYGDGTEYTLRRPSYDVQFELGDPGSFEFSPRVAPQIVGMGLLETIPEEDIVAYADEDDADGDGISGRPNYVIDAVDGSTKLGRFGWKANVPHLAMQVQGAFLGDIGITSPLFPDQNCPDAQAECLAFPGGDNGNPEGTEISALMVGRVNDYQHLLGVPGRRYWENDDVVRGKEIFFELGCAGCHVETYVTGEHPVYPELNGQTIRPYTDLLLHDMGADLADGRGDYLADGREWRTPPLWGIGLIETVNGHLFLLHDGRARGFAEAILWHGGEAAASRNGFKALSADDRQRLVDFLYSL